jgi:hypothetical protein
MIHIYYWKGRKKIHSLLISFNFLFVVVSHALTTDILCVCWKSRSLSVQWQHTTYISLSDKIRNFRSIIIFFLFIFLNKNCINLKTIPYLHCAFHEKAEMHFLTLKNGNSCAHILWICVNRRFIISLTEAQIAIFELSYSFTSCLI